MIKWAANLLFQMSEDPTKSQLQVRLLWSKLRLERQKNLFKVRKKLIDTTFKNAQDLDIMMEHFKIYKEGVDKFGILQKGK